MGEKKEKEKENGGATVVLKADIHCDGCASKVIKCIRSFDGVETVTIDGQKITVVGKVDPAKLQDKVEQKTHKKVELISPQPKKDDGDKENAKGKDNSGGDGKKEKKKKETDGKKSEDKSDQKASKDKEPLVTTAVLKLSLHCDGCIQKIYKTITKTKGYQDMKIDTQKDLVTVTGSMDMKALADVLQKQLKRDVAVVPPKKDGEKKEKGGDEGKGKSGGDEENVQGNKMQAPPPVYPYPFVSGAGHASGDYNPYGAQYHAPQIFSDENPNACSVM